MRRNKENPKAFRERNVSPDRRRHTFVVHDYANDGKIVGRIELHKDRFQAIKPSDEVVGTFDTLNAARAVLLTPATKRR